VLYEVVDRGGAGKSAPGALDSNKKGEADWTSPIAKMVGISSLPRRSPREPR
jgi:hypothetical protein